MSILVTGGAGFIGSHLVDSLLEEGHEVIVLDNLSTGRKENLNGKARFTEGDVVDRDTCDELILRFKPEVVFHLASQISVSRSFNEPGFDARENIIGTLNLLECCRKYGSKRFVFASSAAVYGNIDELPVREEFESLPISFYGLSKKTAEAYAGLFMSAIGISTVCLRYSNVYGPRQIPEGEAGVVSLFIDKALSGSNPVIEGDGNQTRDFIFVDDVVGANIKAIKGEPGVYNISTGKACSVNELWQKIKLISGTSAVAQSAPSRTGDIKFSYLSREAAQKGLGWQPDYSLDEGLKRTIEYYKNKE